MTTQPARQRKTPRQRAEETLAVAERRVSRLTTEVAKRRGELEALEDEWQDAQRRRDYAKKDPALVPAAARPSTTSTDPSGDETA